MSQRIVCHSDGKIYTHFDAPVCHPDFWREKISLLKEKISGLVPSETKAQLQARKDYAVLLPTVEKLRKVESYFNLFLENNPELKAHYQSCECIDREVSLPRETRLQEMDREYNPDIQRLLALQLEWSRLNFEMRQRVIFLNRYPKLAQDFWEHLQRLHPADLEMIKQLLAQDPPKVGKKMGARIEEEG